jgi:hypothetical protein
LIESVPDHTWVLFNFREGGNAEGVFFLLASTKEALNDIYPDEGL